MKAVSIYYQKNKQIPQPTNLPDIHTSSALYIELKHAYKKHHQSSKTEVINILKDQFPNSKIDEDLVSFYIENMNGLKIVSLRKYRDELEIIRLDDLYDEKDTYLAIRIYQCFITKHSKFPKMENLE